jgi:branched-subunit amino acid transport protein AzlD
MDTDSPASRLADDYMQHLKRTLPKGFQAVLVVLRFDDGDTAIQSYGLSTEEARLVLATAAGVAAELDPEEV